MTSLHAASARPIDGGSAGPDTGPGSGGVPVLWLEDARCADVAQTGGKAANLSRLVARYRVPPGFCLPAAAFDVGAARAGTLPPAVRAAVVDGYAALAARCGVPEPAVAVRSSAVDEDGRAASFAGEHETSLNIRGVGAVCDAVARCWRSLVSEHALQYRRARNLPVEGARLAVLVQQLVEADVAGVLFTADPVTNSRAVAVLTVSWGLGESVVGGTVTPDTYVVRKDTLEITSFSPGYKDVMTVLVPGPGGGTHEVGVDEARREVPCIDDAQARDAVRLGLALERELGWPADVECAWKDGVLYLLQCRPITTLT